MAKQDNSDTNSNIFVGCAITGVALGFLVSVLTDNWYFSSIFSTLGVGIGYFTLQAKKKK